MGIDCLWYYAADILNSPGMQAEKGLDQHGGITVYEHSCRAAKMCFLVSKHLPFRVDRRRLIRGALLHDYFLYDWHIPDKSHRLHGFTHPGKALINAKRDFFITEIEEDMILHHMFPLTPTPPKTTEGKILCVADKLCAAYETVYGNLCKAKGRLVWHDQR